MKKLLLCLLLFPALLPTPAFGALDDNTCLGYTLSCDEATNTLTLSQKGQDCLFLGELTEATLEELQQKGVYLPANDDYTGPRQHACTLGDHTIKVEMSNIETPTDSNFSYYCIRSYAYIMVADIWVDGAKVVDGLYFNGVCDKQEKPHGADVYTLSMKLEEGGKPSAPDITFITKVFKDVERKEETFFLKTDPAYKGGEVFKGQEILPAPLKNIHVHDDDMIYEFWDPNEAREKFLEFLNSEQ